MADLELAKGDRLFLYTNGLVDCTSPRGDAFTSERLIELVTSGRGKSLQDVTDSGIREAVSGRGSAPAPRAPTCRSWRWREE